MYKRINGIQHIGVGVPDSEVSQKWYRKFLGMDIAIFDGVAPAPLMDIYTNNETITKRATMILNLQGGCAMEVVNPTSFSARHAEVDFELGDLGIFIGQVKTNDVRAAYEYYKHNGAQFASEIEMLPLGGETFYVQDPNGLLFQILKGDSFYTKGKHVTGGPNGCVIGVSDIAKAMTLYSDVLGYDKVIFDKTGVFEDWKSLPGGEKEFRRVRLTQSDKPGGGFAKVTSDTYIELVEAMNYTPKKIYEGRIWGDIGFVHLGFDVRGMVELGKDLEEKGLGLVVIQRIR